MCAEQEPLECHRSVLVPGVWPMRVSVSGIFPRMARSKRTKMRLGG